MYTKKLQRYKPATLITFLLRFCRYMKTDIPGAATGKLSGKTVAIKDNVCVAGVPMMNGSKLIEGYTPEFDATVVTRVLDAGRYHMIYSF